MKRILLLCLLQSNFMHAMESGLRPYDSNNNNAAAPNYLSILPDPIITNVMCQLMIVEDSNIAQNNNGIFFSDDFRASDRHEEGILQIRNVKNFGKTCKHHQKIVKNLLEDKNSDTLLGNVITTLGQKFLQMYKFSHFDKKNSLNPDSSHELYIAANLNCIASITWLAKKLDYAKKYNLGDGKDIQRAMQDMKNILGQSFARRPYIPDQNAYGNKGLSISPLGNFCNDEDKKTYSISSVKLDFHNFINPYPQHIKRELYMLSGEEMLFDFFCKFPLSTLLLICKIEDKL